MARKRTPTLSRKPGLYLKDVDGKGRGVFCRTAVRKREVLEVSPAVLLNEAATLHADKTILRDYTFIIGNVSKGQRKRAGIKNTGKTCCVIMGMMSFCNHDAKHNAEITWEERGGTVYYYLEATRAIPKNTEICTVYGKNWFEDRE